ncbi:MAG TPA: acyltransferase, partial [Sphingomonas sp.]|nr:acyltransferase [Sphingomonas sp.]
MSESAHVLLDDLRPAGCREPGTQIAKTRLLGLDALRGILAIAVVARHTSFLTHFELVPSGFFAVDVFFMMSGFVIAHAYEAKLLKRNYVREYIWRRYSRLAPMWVIGLSIGTVSTIIFAHRDVTAMTNASIGFIFGIFFIPAFFGKWLFLSNPPGWSLFFEVTANFLYAFLVRILRRRILIITVVGGAILVAFASWGNRGMDGGPTWATAYIGVARTIFGFAVGIIIYERRSLLTGRKLPGALFVICVAAFCAIMAVNPGPRYAFIFDLAVIITLCPLMVILALNCDIGPRWLAESLGALSYPLYAIHFA